MKTLFVFLVALAFSLISPEQDKVYSDLERAFSRGDEKAILMHSGDKLLLEIDKKESVYSKAQAEMILRDFFEKNRPTSFKLIFKGNSKGNSAYSVGILESQAKKYRITITLKENGSLFKIEQLKIEVD